MACQLLKASKVAWTELSREGLGSDLEKGGKSSRYPVHELDSHAVTSPRDLKIPHKSILQRPAIHTHTTSSFKHPPQRHGLSTSAPPRGAAGPRHPNHPPTPPHHPPPQKTSLGRTRADPRRVKRRRPRHRPTIRPPRRTGLRRRAEGGQDQLAGGRVQW